MSSQQDDFYNDLISIVAHDLKTPISAVKGFIELVQQAGPLNDQQMHFSERALGTLDKMQHLIANLLEYTRINMGTQFDLDECDLGEVITDAVLLIKEVATQRHIDIEVQMDPNPPILVMADIRLLSQVMDNLLGNAVKYNRDDGQVLVTVSEQGDFVQIDIRDSGIGIPVEDLPRVFERFYRARSSQGSKIDGSGLGLAIVESIVRKHGGQIWVESVEGEGSTFSFTLPRTVEQVDRAVDPGQQIADSGGQTS